MILRVDPCDPRSLIARESEYVRAMMRARGEMERVPDAIVIQLYAYEVLERMRDSGEQSRQAKKQGRWVVPFWPPVVLVAAGVTAHAWAEIARMLPAFAGYEFVERGEAEIVSEAERILGVLRFDARVYVEELRRHAERAGWCRIDPLDSSGL